MGFLKDILQTGPIGWGMDIADKLDGSKKTQQTTTTNTANPTVPGVTPLTPVKGVGSSNPNQNTVTPATNTRAPIYHKGIDRVPKTGPAILKKDEAVLNTKDAAEFRKAKGKNMAKHSVIESTADALGGSKKEEKPKKEIKEIHIKKGASGGHIIKHVHTHPEHHPDEEHVTHDTDGLADHVVSNMTEPNPGEADADAGQSGIPGGDAAPGSGAAPAAGAAAPSGGSGPIPGM